MADLFALRFLLAVFAAWVNGFAGMPGCNLLVSPDALWFATASATGEVAFGLQLPNNQGLLGLPLFGQIACAAPQLNAAGLGTSRGLRVGLGRGGPERASCTGSP